MGYTHYWYTSAELDKDKFANVVEDFRKVMPVLRYAGVRLAGPHGIGHADISSDAIAFNGPVNCEHTIKSLGIAWPASGAKGVNLGQHKVAGTWFAGAKLNTRTCGGDCSHETFRLEQKVEPNAWQKPVEKVMAYDEDGRPLLEQDDRNVGKYFNFCKTAYKPYDLAVVTCLIIAKHHLGDAILIHSDGELDDWRDGMTICGQFLGYGADFKLDEED